MILVVAVLIVVIIGAVVTVVAIMIVVVMGILSVLWQYSVSPNTRKEKLTIYRCDSCRNDMILVGGIHNIDLHIFHGGNDIVILTKK